MNVSSQAASREKHIVCPLCERGALGPSGPGFARCDYCGLPLLGSALETLRDVIGLPDVLGTHPCECGHPEMRRLPDGVYHCPACGSEVLPIETLIDPKRTRFGSASAWNTGGPHTGTHTSLRNYGEGG